MIIWRNTADPIKFQVSIVDLPIFIFIILSILISGENGSRIRHHCRYLGNSGVHLGEYQELPRQRRVGARDSLKPTIYGEEIEEKNVYYQACKINTIVSYCGLINV